MSAGSKSQARGRAVLAGGLRFDPRMRGGPARAGAFMRARPVGLGLGAALAASLGATIAYCLQLQNYFVMGDELGYVQQATFIAAHLRPVLPGDAVFASWSQLEPLLLAFPYGLLSTPTAFDVAHVLNAVALVSTAWPAYLLTRRVATSRGAAALVAALTVAVPWMTLAGAQLTENVAYPAFVWMLLAAHLALMEPRPRNDLLLLAAAAVGYAARTQLSLVAGALAVGVLLHEVGWAWRGARLGAVRGLLTGLVATVRRHPLLVLAAAGGGVVAASVSSPDIFGAYQTAVAGDLLPPGTWSDAREIFVQVVLGTGGVPLALTAAWLLATFIAPAGRREHALASLMLPVLVLVTIALGSFSARFTAGVNDRYLFFFAPLLFLGSTLLVLDRRRLLAPLAIGTAAAAVLVGTATLAQRGPSLVSPAAAFHDVLAGVAGVPTMGVVMVVTGAALVAGARVLGARRTSQLAVGGAVLLAFCAAETGYTMVGVAATQHASAEFLAGRDWVDRAVPGRGGVAALLSVFHEGSRYESVARWWDATFWNSDIRCVLRYDDGDDLVQQISTPLQVDPRTGALRGLRGSRWLLVNTADARLAVRGAVATQSRYGMELMRLPAAPAAAWAWQGLTVGARLPLGNEAILRIWSPARAATIVFDGRDAERGTRLRVTPAGGGARTVDVPRGRRARVTIALPGRTRPRLVTVHSLGHTAADPSVELGPRIVSVSLTHR